MLYKIALTECSPIIIDKNRDGSGSFIKTASGRVMIEPNSDKERIVKAEITKHPNALFFRAKAIEADKANNNGDYFSTEELMKAYKTFEGVPFFTNHDNQNIENARGKVIFAEWVPAEKSIYTISFIDRDAYPRICRSIEEEYVSGVSMGSLNGESEIVMGDLSRKTINNIEIGETVISPKGNVCEVIDIHCDVINAPMVQLDLRSYHKSPLFSPDHPVLVIKGDEVKNNKLDSAVEAQANGYLRRKGRTEEFVGQDGWRNKEYDFQFIEAQNIKKGDFVLVPSKYKLVESNANDIDSDYFYLAGAYLGDGYAIGSNGAKGVAYYIGLHEKDTLGQKLIDTLSKFSDKNITTAVYPEKGGYKVCVYDHDMQGFMMDNFKKLSHGKLILKREWTKEQISQLLSGYIDTDGCIVKTYTKTKSGEMRGNGIRGVQISSCNERLLEDVQSLMILLDIPSYIKCSTRVPNKNSVVNKTTIEYTLFIPYGQLNKISQSLKINGLNQDMKPEIKAGRVFIVSKDGQKYMACDVKDTNFIVFDEPTYDLTVKDDESYIADGIAVHNCSVEYSTCNICENSAETTEQYCTHIQNRKGRKFTGTAKNVVTGETKTFKDELVFEFNHGIKFIELSAVVDPACPSCNIEGIIPNENYMAKVASMQNSLYMIKQAAMDKKASQEELQQIEQVLATLETIAINLVKNRKQVEMEFASDLVEIMSNLQTWMDELVGAGYGNLQNNAVPGTAGNVPDMSGGDITGQAPMGGVDMSQGAPGPAPMPVAESTPMAGQAPVGQVGAPQMPISTPVKPSANSFNNMKKIADENKIEFVLEKGNQILRAASTVCDKMKKYSKNEGDSDMSRRTASIKKAEKEKTQQILSNSWQEKQGFMKYIKEMPNMKLGETRLSVRKSDESFVIVAEKVNDEKNTKVWRFEDLDEGEKQLIVENPVDASKKFLQSFAKNQNQKGVQVMSNQKKQAGATTVHTTPDVITERQLSEKNDLYHSRQGEDIHEITQKQLDAKRKGEKDYLTEKQLCDSELKLNPRRDDTPTVITEAQMDGDNRLDDDKHSITQNQLEDGYRVDNEPNVITEKQLSNVAAPWARAANRATAQFKSAGDHMEQVINALAEVSIDTGATPDELKEMAHELVASTKSRYEFANALLDEVEVDESLPFAKRASFWSSRKMTVASAKVTDVEKAIVNKLRRVASDPSIDTEILMDAVDVIGDDDNSIESITKVIDEKIAEASANKSSRVNVKSELRKALAGKTVVEQPKTTREERDEQRKVLADSLTKETRSSERKQWDTILRDKVLNPKAIKQADTLIETTFEEIGTSRDKNNPQFKKDIISFTKGALASHNVKLAAITNVTIDGDCIQIAVQTGEGDSIESVEIPVGKDESPAMDETVPEGDLTGEGMEGTMGQTEQYPPTGQMAPATNQFAGSSKRMTKVAQSPMGGEQAMGGAGTAPIDPTGGVPGGAPAGGDPIQSLMGGEAEEISDDIPTVGEKQPPWAICPSCGSTDVDIVNSEDGSMRGECNSCPIKFEAVVKRNVEFTILNPNVEGEGSAETPEEPATPGVPEVPAMPVAANIRMDKGSIIALGKNMKEFGHVCPSCGNKKCEQKAEKDGHTDVKCQACGTKFTKDILVSSKNPKNGIMRVAWHVYPDAPNCPECVEKAKKFASRIKIEKMLKNASAKANEFPMSNCRERLAREYGGDTVASFGPCKGKLMSDCVCKELQRLGFTKVRQMLKLAEASAQTDPMDECVKDQLKRGHSASEARDICGCIKTKVASKISDNIYAHAFLEDIEEGKEKSLDKIDIETLKDIFDEAVEKVREAIEKIADEEEIGDDLPPVDSIEVDVEEVADDDDSEIEIEIVDEDGGGFDIDVTDEDDSKGNGKKDRKRDGSCCDDDSVVEVSEECETEECEQEIGDEDMNLTEALAMNGKRVRRSAESTVKIAGKPKKVDSIEGNVEAKVPRSKATIRNEGPSNIDVPCAKPQVPRGKATMGNEGADNIDVKMDLPDVPVDSSYMGVEKEIQKGMPAINNEIKGTVIAETDTFMKLYQSAKTAKEKDALVQRFAKKMKEVDTVEGDVEAGVPRGKATIGKEGPDNIDVKVNKPQVPRGKATMGNEGADNIDVKMDGPDVPIDNSYMGEEKEVQKDMPGINDKYLKNVQQKREQQMERIASARREKARDTYVWLVANKRVENDKETFESVINALSNFEIDNIESAAEKLFPAKAVKTASTKEEHTVVGHAIPGIVLESKTVVQPQDELQSKLSGHFTVGNREFNKYLNEGKEQ